MPYPSTLHNEIKILEAISQGDEKAFSLIYNHYHQGLGMHIYRITKSAELAEEVVHDVFLKIWLNREVLAEIQNFSVYLYVVSKNTALNCLKKTAREQITTRVIDDDLDQMHITEPIEEDYRYMLIDEAIDGLPPQQRQVYLLSRHERLKYAEVAIRMGISKETVKKYLQIATEFISNYIRKRLIISIILFISQF